MRALESLWNEMTQRPLRLLVLAVLMYFWLPLGILFAIGLLARFFQWRRYHYHMDRSDRYRQKGIRVLQDTGLTPSEAQHRFDKMAKAKGLKVGGARELSGS